MIAITIRVLMVESQSLRLSESLWFGLLFTIALFPYAHYVARVMTLLVTSGTSGTSSCALATSDTSCYFWHFCYFWPFFWQRVNLLRTYLSKQTPTSVPLAIYSRSGIRVCDRGPAYHAPRAFMVTCSQCKQVYPLRSAMQFQT